MFDQLAVIGSFSNGNFNENVPSEYNFAPSRFFHGSHVMYSWPFLASRGPFSFAFTELTSTKKKSLCHGSKLNVLSRRGGFLATESSRDASCCVCSLNSGITATECAGHTQRAQVTASKHITGHADLKSAIQGCGRLLDQVSSTHGRGLFSRTRQRERKERESWPGITSEMKVRDIIIVGYAT